jgi:phenylacetic acid degradation operon negative regulatory protein
VLGVRNTKGQALRHYAAAMLNKSEAPVITDEDGELQDGEGLWLERPQPQDLIITLLSTYVRGRRSTVWSGGLVKLLSDLGFSTGAARVALARLVRRDVLRRVKEGRLVEYEISPHSQRLMREQDANLFAFGREQRSQDTITILWHSLPEDRRLERSMLVKRLRFLGFGSIQDATWIGPGDRESEVVSLVRDLGISQYCSLILGTPTAALTLRPLIERGWDRDALLERYATFMTLYRPYRTAASRARLTDTEAFLVRTRCIHNYRFFPAMDLALPGEPASATRRRAGAARLFDEVQGGLEQAALRHFDDMTDPGDAR